MFQISLFTTIAVIVPGMPLFHFYEKKDCMEKIAKHQITEKMWPEKTFIIKKATVSFDKLTDFFSSNYDKIYAELSKVKVVPTEPPCAIYYKIDEAKNETELAAAVPVPTKTINIKDYETFTLPASKVVMTTHIGPYDTMMPAYEDLENYLKDNKLKKGLIIEEYFSDPSVEKDPAKWKTNIYFTVK
jgi:effector-binding domain-containing protein